MAYTDPCETFTFVTLADGDATEVETAADILALCGRVGNEDEGTDADHDAVRCPNGALIECFGVQITEALTNGDATHCVVALKVVDKEGGSTTTVATLTLPKDSTEVTPSTQTSPSDRTAAQAVAAGARLLSSDSDIPYRVPPGGRFYVEVTQAAGGAGGAFYAFVTCRRDGSFPATAASPVTKIAS